MKIVTGVGARPQFVKAAAVSREIAQHHDINEVIVHTGQHFDKNMSDVFFEEMQIPTPRYHLNINSVNHGAMTGRMLEGIEPILLKEKPEFDKELKEFNLKIGKDIEAEGGKVIYIKIINIRPKTLSRIEKIELEPAN